MVTASHGRVIGAGEIKSPDHVLFRPTVTVVAGEDGGIQDTCSDLAGCAELLEGFGYEVVVVAVGEGFRREPQREADLVEPFRDPAVDRRLPLRHPDALEEVPRLLRTDPLEVVRQVVGGTSFRLRS